MLGLTKNKKKNPWSQLTRKMRDPESERLPHLLGDVKPRRKLCQEIC